MINRAKRLIQKMIRPLINSYSRAWDFIALTKSSSMYSTSEVENERIANEIGKYIKPKSVVLDIGCGFGRHQFVENYIV